MASERALRHAAHALGATRWEMIRASVFPHSRSGLVAGILIGLGRALGETIAVFFVIKIVFDPVNYYQILESGGGSVATLIVAKFGEEYEEYKRTTKRLIPYIY